MKLSRLFLLPLLLSYTSWAQVTHLTSGKKQLAPIVPYSIYNSFTSFGNTDAEFATDLVELKDYSINPTRPINRLLVSQPLVRFFQINLDDSLQYSLAPFEMDSRIASLQQDIDGDQYDDFVVTYFGAGPVKDLYGVSGRTGTVIYHTTSTLSSNPNQVFPRSSLESGADFDGDGVNDVVLSQIEDFPIPNGFEIFSGATGTSICFFILAPDTTIIHAGRMSFKMDDLEGDGVSELLVGYQGRDEVGIYQYQGEASCAQIGVIHSPQPGLMGAAVNTITDQDSDGKRDVIVSDQFRATPFGGFGAVYILSSSTSALLQTLFSPEPQSTVLGLQDFATTGRQLLVEDVTGDGIEDITVSDQLIEPTALPGITHGRVYTYDVASGNIIKIYDPIYQLNNDRFGLSITTVTGKHQQKYLVVGTSHIGLGRLDLFPIP